MLGGEAEGVLGDTTRGLNTGELNVGGAIVGSCLLTMLLIAKVGNWARVILGALIVLGSSMEVGWRTEGDICMRLLSTWLKSGWSMGRVKLYNKPDH